MTCHTNAKEHLIYRRESGDMGIKIILADDHKIVRDGLRTLLERESDMEVIAEAEDGRAVVNLAKQLSPDLVIMDIIMPGLNGIDATRDIIRKDPHIKVIGLSMHSDKRFVSGMFQAGASGYLLKDCAFDELATAVRTVVSNHTYLSPGIANIIIERQRERSSQSGSTTFTNLTTREREILHHLADGMSSKDISSTLDISVKTVQSHRQNIMRKLNINNVTDLIKYAIREGLTSMRI